MAKFCSPPKLPEGRISRIRDGFRAPFAAQTPFNIYQIKFDRRVENITRYQKNFPYCFLTKWNEILEKIRVKGFHSKLSKILFGNEFWNFHFPLRRKYQLWKVGYFLNGKGAQGVSEFSMQRERNEKNESLLASFDWIFEDLSKKQRLIVCSTFDIIQ